MDNERAGLRYVDAHSVDSPAGRLDGFAVVDASNAPLGTLQGIVVDPAGRRVCGYVIESCDVHARHYVVPSSARLDRRHHTIAMDVDEADIADFADGKSQTVPAFSDDDLMTALFHSRSART